MVAGLPRLAAAPERRIGRGLGGAIEIVAPARSRTGAQAGDRLGAQGVDRCRSTSALPERLAGQIDHAHARKARGPARTSSLMAEGTVLTSVTLLGLPGSWGRSRTARARITLPPRAERQEEFEDRQVEGDARWRRAYRPAPRARTPALRPAEQRDGLAVLDGHGLGTARRTRGVDEVRELLGRHPGEARRVRARLVDESLSVRHRGAGPARSCAGSRSIKEDNADWVTR